VSVDSILLGGSSTTLIPMFHSLVPRLLTFIVHVGLVRDSFDS
jgi:hypothetical protein